MNIVYLLTNKSKSSGKRFYIGSKSECKIVKLNGVDTMINVATGKPYMSSSTSFEFKEDITKGDVFEVSILQQLRHSERSRLVEIENEWIVKMNAVNSPEYYNLGYALLNCRDQGKLANRYGQTVGDLAKDNSSMSKRDGTARELGYNNYGDMCFDLYAKYLECRNWATVAKLLNKHRAFARVNLAPFNMEKAILDLEVDRTKEIRTLLADNCSLAKACLILDIELPAGRKMLGEYLEDKSFSVAFMNNKTSEELEVEITKRILDGEGFREISNSLGIVYESVKRYFFRCIRKRLKSSDL